MMCFELVQLEYVYSYGGFAARKLANAGYGSPEGYK